MTRHRAVKDRARSLLHGRMKVKGFFYPDGPDSVYTVLWFRVNSKDEAVGDLAGTSLGYAERRETVPKLIFLAEDHSPERGNVYIVSPHEGYRVDSVDPQDGITITANCVRLTSREVGTYEPPEC